MSMLLLREASRETRELLARHPDPSTLPLSAQIAYALVSRLPNIVRVIDLLVADGLAVEAIAVRRPLIESAFKCAFVLQTGPAAGGPAVDRPLDDREATARDLWLTEQLGDIDRAQRAAPFAPGVFSQEQLEQMAFAKARIEEELEADRSTYDMARVAGMADEYRRAFGPTSRFAHGNVGAALLSVREASADTVAESLEHSAKWALVLLNVAAQLLGDQLAAARALELGARIIERP